VSIKYDADCFLRRCSWHRVLAD